MLRILPSKVSVEEGCLRLFKAGPIFPGPHDAAASAETAISCVTSRRPTLQPFYSKPVACCAVWVMSDAMLLYSSVKIIIGESVATSWAGDGVGLGSAVLGARELSSGQCFSGAVRATRPRQLRWWPLILSFFFVFCDL